MNEIKKENLPEAVKASEIEMGREAQWLLPDWLPCGRLAVLFGESGIGKSTLALRLAACLAAESFGGPKRKFLGIEHRARQPVVFVSWSDELSEHRRRINRMEKHGNLDAYFSDDCPLHMFKPSAASPLFLDGNITAVGEHILAYSAELKVRLLVLDSATAAFGTRSKFLPACCKLEGWAEANDCTVMILDSSDDDWTCEQFRAIWRLSKSDGGTKLECVKSSYGPPQKPLTLLGVEPAAWQTEPQ